MKILNRKDVRNLRRILEILEHLDSYNVKKESLRTNKTLRLATEKQFLNAGELIKKFRDNCSNLFKSNLLFRTLAKYRDKLAHTVDTDVEIVIKSFDSIKDIKKGIKSILEQNYSEDDKLASFEMFGGLGSKTERQKYVAALEDKLNSPNEEYPLSFPESGELGHISKATKAILNHSELLELSQENSEVSRELAQDIVKWAKQLSNKLIRTNPFEEEEEVFEDIYEYNLKGFQRRFGMRTS